MASIANDKGGNRRIQFVAPDGKRKTIRLGKVSKRADDGLASNTIRKRASNAKQFFQDGVDRDLLTKTPVCRSQRIGRQ